MKLPGAGGSGRDPRRHRRRGGSRSAADRHVTDLLKVCLQKVCELQAEINSEESHDAEAAGYSACALEALRFLYAQGLSADHPTVVALREKLLRGDRE